MKGQRHAGSSRFTPYFFILPAVVFYAIFFLFSIGFGLWVSFREWDMLTPLDKTRFVGLSNYVYLFTKDDLFLPVLRNTLVFAIGSVLFSTAIALILAVALQNNPRRGLWRTLYFLPMVTSVVAIANIWRYLYDPNFGLFNGLLSLFHIPGLRWIDSTALAMPSLIAVSVWATIGGALLLFAAGLEGIPTMYYEAARLDGCSGWNEFRHITLPLLRPTLLFVLITGFINGLQSFALTMIMTGGGPVNSTRVLALYMYETAFQNFRMGRASAMAFVLFLIIFLITLLQLRIFRRGGVEAH